MDSNKVQYLSLKLQTDRSTYQGSGPPHSFSCGAKLYLIIKHLPSIIHAVGVSLQLLGQTIPNNSLVNLDDLLYQSPEHPGFAEAPTNANGRLTLMCVTDLVACCETQALGDWYYPDGTRVTGLNGRIFRTNRGQNEVRSGLQFYGSVRLWRRYTPPERGIFRCEIPDANGVNQALYVSICEFPLILDFSID